MPYYSHVMSLTVTLAWCFGFCLQCFIEMERGEDAERFVESARLNPLKFEGKRLLVYISRKYKQLKHGLVLSFYCFNRSVMFCRKAGYVYTQRFSSIQMNSFQLQIPNELCMCPKLSTLYNNKVIEFICTNHPEHENHWQVMCVASFSSSPCQWVGYIRQQINIQSYQ